MTTTAPDALSVYDIDAERAVIGAVLTDAAVLDDVLAVLTPSDFYDPRNEAVFTAAVALHGEGKPVDPITVGDRLERADLDRIGGTSALFGVAGQTVTAAAAPYYAGIVADAATRRRLTATATRIADAATRLDVATAIGVARDEVEKFTARIAEDALDAGPWVDVAALIADGTPEPPAPTVCQRTDGHALFYAGQTNVLFGDPESGKTWLAYAAVVEALDAGQRALIVDADHNGAPQIISRLILLGADPAVLADRDRFRLHAPDDADHLVTAITAAAAWRPDVAVIDSIGEVLPALGLSSNDPDDFTRANRAVLVPLASAGAAVIGIDHLAKGADSRASGQTGTTAKRRAIGGVSIRVTRDDAFTPGRGGSATLTINKDRPGGLRAASPAASGRGEADAGTFHLTQLSAGGLAWKIEAPGEDRPAGTFRPTVLMERVSRFLEAADGPQSQRQITEGVKGRDVHIRAALRVLVDEGRVAATASGKSHLHTVTRPYRENDDDTADDQREHPESDPTASPRPTASPPRPGRGHDRVPASRPLGRDAGRDDGVPALNLDIEGADR